MAHQKVAAGGDSNDFKDFDVEVQQGDSGSDKYVLRVRLKSNKKDGRNWLKQGFSRCVSNTNRLVRNVKDSRSTSAHSKQGSSPVDSCPDIGISWNGVVDFVVSLAVKEVLKNGAGEIPLPNIEEDFDGESKRLVLKNGVLNDLTTLKRIGNVTAVKAGSSIKLSCALGLSVLNITYSNYAATLWGVGPAGHLNAYIGNNMVRLSVSFKMHSSGECKVHLNEIKVEELSNVKVKLTGFGPLNWVASKVSSWQAGKRTASLAATVEKTLTEQITKFLEEIHCDDFVIMLKM